MSIFGLVCIALLFVISYLYLTNHVVRYYVKFTYYGVCIVFIGLWIIPYCLITRKTRDARNVRAVANFWDVVMRLLNVKIEVRNAHHLENDSHSLVMSNHQSAFDLTPIFRVIPYKTTCVAKRELMYAGTFGFTVWFCGGVFIDRTDRKKNQSTMDQTVQQLVATKIRLWMFPEGTREMGDSLLPFKKGGFHIAVQSQCKIHPVVMSSYRHFLSSKDKIFNPGKIIVTCLPPVSTEGMTSKDVNDLIEKVQPQMNEVFKKTTKEVEEWAVANGQSILASS